jgi:hypothetical protein
MVIAMILLSVILVKSCTAISNEVESKGLKNIISEVWEGSGSTNATEVTSTTVTTNEVSL